MGTFFRRQQLAADLAVRLLQPSLLDEGLRSGLFLVGMRRTGKTTFLRNDKIPELERRGAAVVYVDLWSDTRPNPAATLQAAIRQSIADLNNPPRRKSCPIRTESDDAALTDDLTDLVEQSRSDVVLIVDEVLEAMNSVEGHQMLQAIKAARDAINTRPSSPGHFVLVGTHSRDDMLHELTMHSEQAFAGATVIPFPLLDEEYVHHVLARLSAEGEPFIPTPAAAWEAFQALGYRPEEFLRALRHLQCDDPMHLDPNQHLALIVKNLQTQRAEMELSTVENMGDLAPVILDWMAEGNQPMRGHHVQEGLQTFSTTLGRTVSEEEIQSVLHNLSRKSIIKRLSFAHYTISDPVVLQVWRERRLHG